ncbi:MAG: queuosine precursor transporter [bacterium]
MNELYWGLMLLLNFGAIMLSYRLFGKTGLFIWTPIAVIVANIQVLKTIELFGVVATLGNIVYATSFLVTDILSENHGKKDARKAVAIGFFSLITMTVLMNVALLFTPHSSDFAQQSLTTLFSILPRIALASLTAYLISQLHDIKAYHFWKTKFPDTRYIWLRNNASTMVSQLLDTVIFTFIAFYGVFPTNVFLEILVTTYLLKWLVAALDTPLVYWAKKMHSEGKIAE